MENKKMGFTLMEVLITIVLVTAVVFLVIPNFMKSYAAVETRTYINKKSLILEAAKMYSYDHREIFSHNNKSVRISVEDLIREGYLSYDISYGENNCKSTVGCIINPDTKDSINNEKIVIYKSGTTYDASWVE